MVITALKGGLGNQLFQYALGRKISLLRSDIFKLDIAGLDRARTVGDIYRPFALGAFAIQASIATSEEVERLKYPYGVLSKALRIFRAKILRQYHVGFEPDILRRTGDLYLDGYWQSPKYFEDIRGTLLEDFTLIAPLSGPAEDLKARMQATNSVSVHVRRGDYVSDQSVARVNGPCTLSYYERAVSEVRKRIEHPTWFVFSDDIDWVKENLDLPGTVIYVSGEAQSDQEELMLMAACSHNVIANSTFSWWGAWLNQNPQKVVVAPTPWFNLHNGAYAHLIPSAWIQVQKA
ncbi:MAG: alpha-1,2-fucosyltransferase [Patescibacteria group bacterium]